MDQKRNVKRNFKKTHSVIFGWADWLLYLHWKVSHQFNMVFSEAQSMYNGLNFILCQRIRCFVKDQSAAYRVKEPQLYS